MASRSLRGPTNRSRGVSPFQRYAEGHVHPAPSGLLYKLEQSSFLEIFTMHRLLCCRGRLRNSNSLSLALSP